MDTNISLIAFFSFFSIFGLTVISMLLLHERPGKKRSNAQRKDSDWEKSVYKAFFKEKNPVDIAKKIGIEADRYLFACEIAREKANLESLIIHKLLGVLLMLVGLVVGLVLKNYYIPLALLIAGGGVYEFSSMRVQKKAKQRKELLKKELPRFADMLQMALSVNIPVERAIALTSRYLPGTVLAEEFNDSSSEIELGAKSWQKALEDVAQKYEIDDFSDFVLALITSYRKGLSVYDTVREKAKEMRQVSILNMREKANKMNSIVLFPIVIFKLLPLIIIMTIPIISQIKGSGF